MDTLRDIFCDAEAASNAVLCHFLMSSSPEATCWQAFAQWLYDWQTLVAGFLAVGGAGIGALFLWKQIRQQQREFDTLSTRHEEELARQKIAARIRLPHALSDIHVYLKVCLQAWQAKKPDDRPPVPTSAVQTLMDSAVWVDPDTFASIRELIISSQTFEARLRPGGKVVPVNQLDLMLIDILRQIYVVDSLFDYGRLDKESVPYVKPERKDLESVIFRSTDWWSLPSTDPILARANTALDLSFPDTVARKPKKRPLTNKNGGDS